MKPIDLRHILDASFIRKGYRRVFRGVKGDRTKLIATTGSSLRRKNFSVHRAFDGMTSRNPNPCYRSFCGGGELSPVSQIFVAAVLLFKMLLLEFY